MDRGRARPVRVRTRVPGGPQPHVARGAESRALRGRLLLLPGALGKVLVIFTGEWNDYVDILLVGGVALLFAVERRTREDAAAAGLADPGARRRHRHWRSSSG
jgi:hypothetical protein